MTSTVSKEMATIIPVLRYKDASKAIEWLCKAFGFEKHVVAPGPNNTIAHAQLTLGHSMIMLGSATKEGEFGRFIKQPEEIGGAETQSVYIIVSDPDTHYARAKSVGAKILIDIRNEDYGGRGYTCSDLEGHIWNFGSYNPWIVSDCRV